MLLDITNWLPTIYCKKGINSHSNPEKKTQFIKYNMIIKQPQCAQNIGKVLLLFWVVAIGEQINCELFTFKLDKGQYFSDTTL